MGAELTHSASIAISHSVRYNIIRQTEDHPTKYCGVYNEDTTISQGTDAFLPRWYLKPWRTQSYLNR
jgi:hypothetical protein